MNNSNYQSFQTLYRREIEEALEILRNLQREGFYNIPKLTWWVLQYDELNQHCYEHRHNGSCFEGMGCPCSWDLPESQFSSLYSSIQEVVELHQYERYFKEEMGVFEQVRNDHPALMQWLKKNEKLGTEDFILFWIEWLDEHHKIVSPDIRRQQDLEIKFKAREWQYTISFLKEFNEVYWTSDACPPVSS